MDATVVERHAIDLASYWAPVAPQFTIASALMAFHSLIRHTNRSKNNPSALQLLHDLVFSTNHTSRRKFYAHNLSLKFASRKHLHPVVL